MMRANEKDTGRPQDRGEVPVVEAFAEIDYLLSLVSPASIFDRNRILPRRTDLTRPVYMGIPSLVSYCLFS